jgi:hypothetical protein
MRTITLEFVRPGPAHNQLLSPLTHYVALCGSLPAETIQFPFEHQQIVIRLRALQYRESRETREMQLADTARVLGQVLSQVPGLTAELARSSCQPGGMTHLRLILSANELALLPFELAHAPDGAPGAGQHLALQSLVPLCITRESRRAAWGRGHWPTPGRILFATASPDGVGPVPADAHLLALRQVIEPWIAHFPAEERRTRIAEHLTFLPQARLDSIQSALAGGEYTHVHLLAHGVPIDKAGDRRFGLALDDGVADGERLASVLRTRRRGQPDLVKPVVVTLAACDAGQVGSVVGAGASIAHALHEEGIPLVVASQFPLSFAGSVVLTQVLYEGFWSGADPRLLLNDLYRQLQVRVPQTHDWASIVAYAAFPPDLDDQLREVPRQQAKRRLDSALHYADRVTRGGERPADAELERLVGCVEDARRRMRELLNSQGPAAERAEILGLLAATEKRLAEILLRVGREGASLEEARKLYKEAFDADPSQDWCLVQMLSLTAVLRGGPAVDRDLWELARIRSEQELRVEDRRRRAWALGNLIELYLLSLLLENPPAETRRLAHQYARDLLELMGDSFEVHSTRRQLLRYCEFFRSDQPGWEEVVRLAMDLAGSLPASERFL